MRKIQEKVFSVKEIRTVVQKWGGVESNDFLKELVKLSKTKKNWYSIASVYKEFKSQLAGQPYPQRRIREARDATGYSQNALNRMLTVKDFFDSHKSHEKLKDVDPNQLSFSSLEIIKRLYQIDPTQGLAALIGVVDGEYKIRELKKLYDNAIQENISAASVRQSSARESRHFEQNIITLIEGNFEELTGKKPVNIKISSSRSNHFSSIIASSETDKPGDTLSHTGFFPYFSGKSADSLSSTLEIAKKIKFNSLFFERYWIFVPENSFAEIAAQLIILFNMLGLTNTGIATIIKENKNFILKILRQPGSPIRENWYTKQMEFIDFCKSIQGT